LRRFLGTGLVTSNGDFWRRQRRMINPAFNRRRIEAFGDVMVEKSAAAMLSWRPGEVREIGHDMMSITLAIVAKTLFDADTSGEQDRVARALDAFRNSSGAASILPDWVPLPSIRRTNQALHDVDEIVYGLIDERRKETDEALAARGDLLSALLLATEDGTGNTTPGARMTRKELRDELLTLFLAGHETTSQALTWTFYLLSQHPEIEAEVQDELDRVLGGRLATAADDLPLVDRVLQESMRLYPPVTTVARVATEDTEVGGWFIPKGADMICWIYHAHHDPRWWPDPKRFDPDRFRPERLASIPDGAFTPFGAGQRQCIGKHFSLMEARLILATILQRYRLRLVPGHRVERHVAVTMSPRYGMKMAVYPQRH
jgi:cytochrome P450